ncbi:NACHT and WD repeat domain-containing protein [Streptomyces sp. NPDC048231]|uniref:NACHT and WD repeat domain-containing protein n=1 Tax=Streptomyces sp. NPDC048231 TaxID=3365519 RepID=UPI00371BCC47
MLSLGIPLTRTEDGESPKAGLDVLEQAPEHAQNVADALREFQYERYPSTAPDDPADLWRLVENAVISEGIDVLVVHIVGHGELAVGSSDKLYILDSAGKRLSHPASAWIERIEDREEGHRPLTLFVLDVCYAGEVAVTSWHARMDVTARKAWVLAATGPKDPAFGYRLSKALTAVLGKYRARDIRFDPSVQYIPPGVVFQDVERTVHDLAAAGDGGLPQKIITSLVPSHADLSQLPFFPNPSYGETLTRQGLPTGLPPEIAALANWAWDPEHFMRRAGGAEPVNRDWEEGYFCGRKDELHQLSSWLDDETAGPGLRAITGKPGAGKSALLGVLVCAAHPTLRRHTRALWRGLGGLAPGENERIAVVHARRLAIGQIIDSLARQLRHINNQAGSPGQSGGDPAPLATNVVDHLTRLLPNDGRPVTVIIDALDEADRPEQITSDLLLPLAERAQDVRSGWRLLVGTRDDERFSTLLRLARKGNGCTDLSSAAPESVRSGVTEYVDTLLSADGPYAHGTRRPARQALAQAVATRLTEAGPTHGKEALQSGEFLTAGLYVHYVLAAEQPRDTPEAAAELGRAVPRSLTQLLELDLRRHQNRPHLRAVLTALAFGQGRGVPESVLVHTAAAFADSNDDPLSLHELYALLDGEARFYLRRAVDVDGTTLYRLFHEGLAEWLRDSAERRSPGLAGPDSPGSGPADTPAGRLYERLLTCVPHDGHGQKLWRLAAPYLQRHTAQHALEARLLDDLLEDCGFLVHADPLALAEAFPHARTRQARLNAKVYRSSWALHRAAKSPTARLQLLTVDAARLHNHRMRAVLPGDPHWSVRWAAGHQDPEGPIRALADDHGWIRALAVVESAGRPHVLTTRADGSVRLSDLATGQSARHLGGHNGSVRALAVTELNGKPYALTAGTDRSIRLWDLTTGTQTRQLTGHPGPVLALTTLELEGRPHALTAGTDPSMWLWDLTNLTTGKPTHRLPGPRRPVLSLAAVELGGRPHVLTTGADGSARLWDPVTGRQTRKLTGHGGSVRALTVTELDGTPQALIGNHDGSARLWDLASGQQTRKLTGHTGWVEAVAVIGMETRPHALTTSADGTARLWNLDTGSHVALLHLPHKASAVAVAPNNTIVLSIGHEVVAVSLEPFARRLR